MRYQTSEASSMLISRPKTPVNPAKKIATCSWTNAFFIVFPIPVQYVLCGEHKSLGATQVAVLKHP